MKFDFTNYEEKEFPDFKVGESSFIITNAEEKTSSTGNPMLVVHFDITDKDFTTIKDTLDFFPATANMLWKMKRLSEAVGLSLDAGGVANVTLENLSGRTGKCRTKKEKDRNDETKEYVRIASYINKEKAIQDASKGAPQPVQESAPFIDDDIPPFD